MPGIVCALWTFLSLLPAPEMPSQKPRGEAESARSAIAAASGQAASEQAGECASDEDCDDANPCTTDTCVEGTCANEVECSTVGDCDDFNVCTIDECIEGCCQSRPQCNSDADCPENFYCDYYCCIRCPTCPEIRRVWTRCRRGHVRVVMLLRDEGCDGSSVTIDVGGEPSECRIRGRLALCDVRRVRTAETTVCVTDPDCPQHCYDVSCGR